MKTLTLVTKSAVALLEEFANWLLLMKVHAFITKTAETLLEERTDLSRRWSDVQILALVTEATEAILEKFADLLGLSPSFAFTLVITLVIALALVRAKPLTLVSAIPLGLGTIALALWAVALALRTIALTLESWRALVVALTLVSARPLTLVRAVSLPLQTIALTRRGDHLRALGGWGGWRSWRHRGCLALVVDPSISALYVPFGCSVHRWGSRPWRWWLGRRDRFSPHGC